jgi:hypothetical protein
VPTPPGQRGFTHELIGREVAPVLRSVAVDSSANGAAV